MEQMFFFQALIILMLIMPLIILGGIYSGIFTLILLPVLTGVGVNPHLVGMITQPVGNCLNTCSEDGFRFSGA